MDPRFGHITAVALGGSVRCTYEAGPPRSCVFEKQKPGSLKSHGPLGGRMTAQASTSVSKSRSASIGSPRLTAEGDAIIQVQDLAKIFDPDIRAVDGISFAVRRGEIFGFLGPNGAGKTTTIKVITTLIKKTSGSAIVDGINVDKDPAAIRKIIGYAAQEVGIDDELTGRENLRLQSALYHLPKGEREERISELLKAIDLEDAADRRAGTYSGGMRKRLDLAMALIPHPKVLFLDEPTTGLDPQNRAAVWEYIRGLNEQGMTIFLTTQYMEEADRLADRLCIIDHGHIMAEGTPASLKGSIGADVVTLSFKENGTPNPNAAAKAALARIHGIREIQEVDGGIAIYAQDAPALIQQIVLALNVAHLDIAELTLTHPTLDDVFMKYTGRKMRTEEVTPQRRTPWGARRRRPMCCPRGIALARWEAARADGSRSPSGDRRSSSSPSSSRGCGSSSSPPHSPASPTSTGSRKVRGRARTSSSSAAQ